MPVGFCQPYGRTHPVVKLARMGNGKLGGVHFGKNAHIYYVIENRIVTDLNSTMHIIKKCIIDHDHDSNRKTHLTRPS